MLSKSTMVQMPTMACSMGNPGAHWIYNYSKAVDTPPVIAEMIRLMKKEGTQSNPVHPPDEEGALDQCSLLIRRAPDQCSLLARRMPWTSAAP